MHLPLDSPWVAGILGCKPGEIFAGCTRDPHSKEIHQIRIVWEVNDPKLIMV
jgi:hypothetical protein